MSNFDFTQFISIDSVLPYEIVQNKIRNMFIKQGFSVIEYKNIETCKKNYFSDYWRKYSFELEKDDFLGAFMNWEKIEDTPQEIKCFIDSIKELRTLNISNMSLIICSFAEKGETTNECVCIDSKNMNIELFKMSPFSLRCPNNLIIDIEGK